MAEKKTSKDVLKAIRSPLICQPRHAPINPSNPEADMTDDDLPKCAKCGASMTDYEALHDRADADAKNDVPDYAKCKACGELHRIED